MLTKEQRRRVDRLAMDYGRAARLFGAGKTDAAHMANAFGALQDYLDSIPVPEGWKLGDELAPFHPDASHVEPGYRDGWNDCYRAMLAAATKPGGSNE